MDAAEKDTILWVDWANIGFRQCKDSSFANFRLAIHSQTGEIEFLYGPSHITCDSAFSGDTGPRVGMFRSDPSVTTFYEVDFLQGKTTSPKQNLITNPALGGIPEPGRRYLFTPIKADVANSKIGEEKIAIRVEGNQLYYSISDRPFVNSELKVFDITGNTILTSENLAYSGSLDFHSAAGIYIAELRLDNKIIRSKFIKGN